MRLSCRVPEIRLVVGCVKWPMNLKFMRLKTVYLPACYGREVSLIVIWRINTGLFMDATKAKMREIHDDVLDNMECSEQMDI